MVQRIRQWARLARRDVYAVYRAARDPRVPWYAKALAFCVAGYALSPIDLIPDFVPVLGYLDDVIIIPAGLVLVTRLIPAVVLADARERARSETGGPSSRWAIVIVVVMWLLLAGVATIIVL